MILLFSGEIEMKNDKEVGSYGWFREYGHDPLKALKRTIESGLHKNLVPFPYYGPREEHIEDALQSIEARIRYISRADYDPNKPSNARTPIRRELIVSHEELIMGSYGYLQKQPSEYFNERTEAKYQNLEEQIFALQKEGKLPQEE